jgi:hypothetical protein
VPLSKNSCKAPRNFCVNTFASKNPFPISASPYFAMVGFVESGVLCISSEIPIGVNAFAFFILAISPNGHSVTNFSIKKVVII